jgi:Zn-dependent metalloprotease
MKRLLALLTVLVLLPLSFAAAEEESVAVSGPVAKTVEELSSMLDSGESVTNMIDTPFYENVTDEDAAMEAIGSVMDQLGCDETTKLILDTTRPTEDGMTYYTFRQKAGDLAVYGGAAKLIVDKNGTAVAAVATIFPNMPDTEDVVWGITEEEAEEIIRQQMAEDHARVLTGRTHQTLLPISESKHTYYAWVVYTDNPWRWTDVAYVAHYLNENGEYILSIPVSEPWSSDSMSGAGTEFVFEGLEESSWTGEVTMFDGRKETITVPTMTDPETGDVFLGDLKRRIVCAEYADFKNDDTINRLKLENGRWDEGDLLILMNMIRVWDLYDTIGWTGPDGEGTPTLLLMNWVDENGEPVENACYQGKLSGFQVFCFNRVQRDGECLDTLGHEFTHCVSNTLASDLPYLNDTGAINEGLSDTMGNLIEDYIAETDNSEWLIGEGAGDPKIILRCMSDPHRYKQPEYTWDRYYLPHVEMPSDENDSGGVHTNSSLLNLIAWRLHEKGMPVEDEFYYWLNVMMAIVPGVDYPLMAKLLPWSMKQMGYDEWLPALEEAIRETRIADEEMETIPDGCFAVFCNLPEKLQEYAGMFFLTFLDRDWNVVDYTWPDARMKSFMYVIPAGDYIVKLGVPGDEGEDTFSWLLTEDGWVSLDGESPLPDDPLLTFEEGYVYDLPDVSLV